MGIEISIDEERISKAAERILEDVDYDIYKEDLEERNILGDIEYRIYNLLESLEVK